MHHGQGAMTDEVEADTAKSFRAVDRAVLDAATGQTAFAPRDDPHVDDLLDDLAELVLKMGGRVLVVPADRMPATTGLAAT